MDENILEVKCGDVEGVLHKLAFCCPGIRQPCIEVNGEMITPKTFITMGNKQSLKNWKSAIRHNGIPLRLILKTIKKLLSLSKQCSNYELLFNDIQNGKMELQLF